MSMIRNRTQANSKGYAKMKEKRCRWVVRRSRRRKREGSIALGMMGMCMFNKGRSLKNGRTKQRDEVREQRTGDTMGKVRKGREEKVFLGAVGLPIVHD